MYLRVLCADKVTKLDRHRCTTEYLSPSPDIFPCRRTDYDGWIRVPGDADAAQPDASGHSMYLPIWRIRSATLLPAWQPFACLQPGARQNFALRIAAVTRRTQLAASIEPESD